MPPVAGPYSPVRRAGDLVVCSGQLGAVPGPDGPELVPGGTGPQIDQAMANVAELLAGQGLGWEHVVKVTAFLADIGDYGLFNERYVAAVGDSRPARTVVAVAGLPLGAAVEVEVWAQAGQAGAGGGAGTRPPA